MASTNFIDALIPGLRTEKAEILWLEGKDYACACHYGTAIRVVRQSI